MSCSPRELIRGRLPGRCAAPQGGDGPKDRHGRNKKWKQVRQEGQEYGNQGQAGRYRCVGLADESAYSAIWMFGQVVVMMEAAKNDGKKERRGKAKRKQEPEQPSSGTGIGRIMWKS